MGAGGLRYGLIRDVEGLPPEILQRRLLEQAECEVLLEQGRPTRAALRAQRNLLYSLKYGDELLLCSLNTLQMSTGDVALLFRRFGQAGVTLRILDADTFAPIELAGSARKVLSLLAANEQLWPTRQRPWSSGRPKAKALSRYQIDYALGLKKQGVSLRTISQLFQIAPSELGLLMSEGRRGTRGDTAEDSDATASR